MCNEQTQDEIEQQRFIDYRLDQLELNLRKGQEKLEQEYKEQNQQIMKTLTIMQEGQNQQNRTLAELNTRVATLEDKNSCIDKLREIATKNTTEIKDVERRLDIYKHILLAVGTGAGVALLIDIIKLI